MNVKIENTVEHRMKCEACGFNRHTDDVLEIHGIEPVFCKCGNILVPHDVVRIGFFTIEKRKFEQPTPKKTGHIYLFHEIGTNNYKIGAAVDVNKRFKQIKSSSGRNLEIVYSSQIPSQTYYEGETALLSKYHEYKTVGEWISADAGTAYKIVRDIQSFEHGGKIPMVEVVI